MLLNDSTYILGVFLLEESDILIRFAMCSDAVELQGLNELFNGKGCTSAENIKDFLGNNNQEIISVASDRGKIVGFCCGQVFRSMCYTEKHGEITELYVLEEYRRKGIAKKLVFFIEAEFRKQGINGIHILTGNDNIEAQCFYRSCGYEDTDEVMLEKEI